jgi:hypothetical protein
MKCPNCPTVPVVSLQLADKVLKAIPEQRRHRALLAAMEWLVTKHPGLNLYEGIHGRAYTKTERDAIAVETGAVCGLTCPLYTEKGGCLIGGLGCNYNHSNEMGKLPYGWLPTLLARAWALNDYRQAVILRAVADAKVTLLNRNEGFVSKDEHTGQIHVG